MNPIPVMAQLKRNFNSLMIRINPVSSARTSGHAPVNREHFAADEGHAARDWAQELAKTCRNQYTCPKG